MSEQATQHATHLQQGVSNFMDALSEAMNDVMEVQTASVRAAGKVAAIMAKAAVQRVTVQAVLDQRAQLQEQLELAGEGVVNLAITSQIDQLDHMLVESLEAIGVPKNATKKALAGPNAKYQPGGGKYITDSKG